MPSVDRRIARSSGAIVGEVVTVARELNECGAPAPSSTSTPASRAMMAPAAMSHGLLDMMEPQNVNRVFEQLRSDAGLPWLHLHDLHHAFATLLLDQGVELRTVMELLGHSTIRLTADTDGHVLLTKVKG